MDKKLKVTWEEPEDIFEFKGGVVHPVNCPQCMKLIKDCKCPTADELAAMEKKK